MTTLKMEFIKKIKECVTVKKFLVTLFVMLSVCSSTFAAAIMINDVPPKTVRDQIIVYMATNQGQYVLQDQTENMLKFVLTKDVNNLMFIGYANDTVTYTITPSGKNTVVSLNENVLIYRANGTLFSSQVPNNGNFLERILIELKSYYNGSYRFGYNLTEKYKDGYKISVVPDGACEKAGLKTGDVLIMLNDIVLKKLPKKEMGSTALVDMFSSKPATFVISRNGVKKTYEITPKFYEPQYKPENE